MTGLVPLLTGCDLAQQDDPSPQGPPASMEGWWRADTGVVFDTTFAVEGDPTYRSVSIDYDGVATTKMMVNDTEGFVAGHFEDGQTGTGTVRYTRHDGNVVPEPFTVDVGAGWQIEAFYNPPMLRFDHVYSGFDNGTGVMEADFSDGSGHLTRPVEVRVRLSRLGGRTVTVRREDVEVRILAWSPHPA